VAEVSNVYIKETGHPPASLKVLFEEGYLEKKGEWVGINSLGESMALWTDVNKVHLSFPPSPDELALQNGMLVERKSGKKYFLITIEPKPLLGVDIEGANRFLWQQWKIQDHSSK
jgi:hypothetical protein